MYVHYGCAQVAPTQWSNFDASLTLLWERIPIVGRLYTKNAWRFPENAKYGDISKGLPVKDGTAEGVYASHVLEHLSLADFHRALENTKRIMKPGAIFRLAVPDLAWAAREYLNAVNSGDEGANARFLRETDLGAETRPRTLAQFALEFLKGSRHLWMWDFPSMAKALADHGFQNIRSCVFGDCEDQMFRFVESPGRFEHAVAIECRRQPIDHCMLCQDRKQRSIRGNERVVGTMNLLSSPANDAAIRNEDSGSGWNEPE